MNTLDHHSFFNFNKLLSDSMSKIYIYQAFLTFSKSMIGIFVPVYLYKLGFSVVDIILYSLGNSLTYLIMIPLSVKIIKSIGFKNTILLSTPIYIIHLLCLNYLGYNGIFFHLAWLTFGIYAAIFWPAMHSEIAANSSKKHVGSQLGTLQIITTLVATSAPFIGGIFLETLSYWYLLIFASVLILLGTLPMIFSKDVELQKYDFNFSDYLRLIKKNKNGLIYSKIAFASEGVEWLLNLSIWPILVFIFLSKNFLKLGILISIVSLISIIIVMYFKKIVDSNKKSKYLNLITKFLSLNWFLRSFILFFSSFFLYFVETMSKIILNMFNMSFMSIFYNNAKKVGYMDYIILREIYLHGTKIFVGFFVFIPFLLFFGEKIITLSALISFGILFALGLSLIREE